MGNKKFVMLFIFGVVFLMGSAIAVYTLNYQGTRTITIRDDISRITFSDNFVLEEYSSPNEDQVLELNVITIENPTNNTFDYVLTFQTDFIGIGDNCTEDNDVEFGVQEVWNGLVNNSTLSFPPGDSGLGVSATIKAFACAGDYNYNIELNPL